MQTMSFIFKDIPSEDIGLYIGDIGQSGKKEKNGSIQTEVIYDNVYCRDENIVFGVNQKERLLTLDINFFSYNEITEDDVQYIEDYLFNNSQPQKLVICQESMENIYLCGTFTKNTQIVIGNIIVGYETTFTCDSPFAYSGVRIDKYKINSNTETEILFNNQSSGLNYLYPEIEFTCNQPNGYIKIVNETDNNRTFLMDGLTHNETININKWFELKSSLGLNRLGNTNYNFLRLKTGWNKLKVTGNANDIIFKYRFLKSI